MAVKMFLKKFQKDNNQSILLIFYKIILYFFYKLASIANFRLKIEYKFSVVSVTDLILIHDTNQTCYTLINNRQGHTYICWNIL